MVAGGSQEKQVLNVGFLWDVNIGVAGRQIDDRGPRGSAYLTAYTDVGASR